jgi:ABC-type glycerol-3-phosphate transport system substrate-binding protein
MNDSTNNPTSPSPMNSPAPNMPPSDILETPPPPQSTPVSPPLNSPLPSPTTPNQSNPPKAPNPILKKILIIAGIAVFAIVIFFVIIKVLIPILTKSGIPVPFVRPKEIVWWGLWEDSSLVQPIIDEYENSHPNIKVVYSSQSKNEYRDRLSNALAQGNGPDIFRFHNTWVPMLGSRLAAVPQDVYDAKSFADTFYPVAVSDLTTKQGIVGIPLMYDGLALYINEEMFATYGKLTPTTWNELRDTAVDLTIKDENGIIQQSGVALGTTQNVDHWQEIIALMMLQNKVDMNNPIGDRADGAIQFYTQFTSDLGVWDDTLPNSTIYFASGRLGMMFAPSWRVFEIREQNPTLHFKVVPVPQVPKDNPEDPDVTYASYWVEGVNNASDVQPEAWEFLKYLSQKDTLEKLYKLESQADPNRSFGEPYSRKDMKDLLQQDPIVSGFIDLAPEAESWYLASRTFDGDTGINSRLSDYFADAINSYAKGNSRFSQETLSTLSSGVQQVLADFRVIAPTPAPSP